MTTQSRCWPKNANFARTESISAAKQIQALCSTARIHIDAGNKWASQATVNRIETLAVCIERDLLNVKGEQIP